MHNNNDCKNWPQIPQERYKKVFRSNIKMSPPITRKNIPPLQTGGRNISLISASSEKKKVYQQKIIMKIITINI